MSNLMIVEVPSYTCEFKGIRGVRELVRCGECGHHKERYVTFKGEKIVCYRCMEFGIDVEADDFCSYGERSSE